MFGLLMIAQVRSSAACLRLGVVLSAIVPSLWAGSLKSASYRQAGALAEAEEHRRQLALAGGDIEVMHGGDGEHVATVRAAGHEKHVRGGRA